MKKIILIDYNQVTIAAITMQYQFNKELDEGLIRHMILNSFRMYRTKFKDKYGELIIAADDRAYWRKEFFPEYKAHRKGDQKKSTLDWNELFRILNKVRDEIKDNFPYPVIRVDNAEADDIIGALCEAYGSVLGGDPILIVSGDRDFKQLQRFSNVDQWAPTEKKFIRCNNPESYLKEHIMRGDKGDGVPNFLSPDDTFTEGKRQISLTKNKFEEWMKLKPEDFCDDKMLAGWKRNASLVDLTFIPHEIRLETINQLEEQEDKGRDKLFNYFIKHKLKNLMSQLREF